MSRGNRDVDLCGASAISAFGTMSEERIARAVHLLPTQRALASHIVDLQHRLVYY